jgi:hypothetical protein
MKSLSKIAIVILFFSIVTSCASIISTSKQTININTNPSGANVSINGENVGISPLFYSFSRKNDYTVKIDLAGYQPYELRLTRSLNPWVFGNIIFGGLIGIVIDAATGAIYKLSPDQINTNLSPASVSSIKEGVYITVQLNSDPNWTKIGQLEKAN